MKCTSCGNTIKEGENFCTICGTPVSKEPVSYQQPKKNNSKILIPVIIGGVCVVAVMAIIICAVLFNGMKKTDVAVAEPEKVEQSETEESKEAAKDTLDTDEIIENVLGIKKLDQTVFDLTYTCQKSADGYDSFVISAPDAEGYINYQYMDFDGDKEEELFVVALEIDGEDSFLMLHMLENSSNGWKLADSVSKYEENYMTKTSWVSCPECAYVYMGEENGLPVIYVENESIASYFADGVGTSLYQLSYKDENWQFTKEPIEISGSDIEYYLTLNESDAIARGETESFYAFKEQFEQFGLKLETGMYYDTTLYSQNDNLTYVAGYNKYATFTAEDAYNWQVNGANEPLEGIVFEVLDSYKEMDKPVQETEAIPDAEWRSAYYDYLLSKNLSGYVGYSLLYVNDDAIPELYLYGDCEATGQLYATYSNGQVNEVYLGRLYSEYGEKQNVVVSSDGHMGYYYDIIYVIENGVFKQVHEGNYYDMYDGGGNVVLDSDGYPLMEYVWDGETVSMQEYQKRLSDAVGTMKLIKPQIQYRSSGDMIKALQGALANTDASEYIFPESNTSYLSEAQVAALSKEELRLARNEIYARHGYIFTKEDLKAYFQSKSWYVGTTTETISDEFLNEYEIANRDLIAKYEK